MEACRNSEDMRGTGDNVGKKDVQRRKNERQYEQGHKHIEMEMYTGQIVFLENMKETEELINVICKHKNCRVTVLPPGCQGGSWSQCFYQST